MKEELETVHIHYSQFQVLGLGGVRTDGIVNAWSRHAKGERRASRDLQARSRMYVVLRTRLEALSSFVVDQAENTSSCGVFSLLMGFSPARYHYEIENMKASVAA